MMVAPPGGVAVTSSSTVPPMATGRARPAVTVGGVPPVVGAGIAATALTVAGATEPDPVVGKVAGADQSDQLPAASRARTRALYCWVGSRPVAVPVVPAVVTVRCRPDRTDGTDAVAATVAVAGPGTSTVGAGTVAVATTVAGTGLLGVAVVTTR